MYILASHNSWSYLIPRKWWMKLIAFTARCQEVSIEEQYNLGVRMFDLRVRFDDDGFKVCHGLIEYKIDTLKFYEIMRFLNYSNSKVYVRVLLEDRSKKENINQELKFKDFCEYLEKSFRSIYFFGGHAVNKDYIILYNFEHETPTIEHKYSSTTKPSYVDDWWPWLYAFCHNEDNKEIGTNKQFLMLDYVNI